jgi:hypothetical protein
MKKTIYITAILALTACSNDELVDSSVKDASRINVSVVTNNVSRAGTSSDCKDIGTNEFCKRHDSNTDQLTFRLYAAYCDNYLKAQYVDDEYAYLDGNEMKFNKSSSNATNCAFTEGDVYWPKDIYQYLCFFGLHDYNKEADSDQCSLTYINEDDYPELYAKYPNRVALGADISLNKDAKQQDDIMYAVSVEPLCAYSGQDVNLNFRHALSQLAVEFENKSTAQYLYVEINSVSFTKAPIEGQVLFFNNNNEANYPGEDVQYTDEDKTKNDHDNRSAYNEYYCCAWIPQSLADYEEDEDHDVTYTFEQKFTDPDTRKAYTCDYRGLAPEHSYGLSSTTGTSTSHPLNMLVVPYDEDDITKVKLKISCRVFGIADYDNFKTLYDDTFQSSSDNNYDLEYNYDYKIHDYLTQGTQSHGAFGVPIFGGYDEDCGLYDDYCEDADYWNWDGHFQDIYIDLPQFEDGWKAGKKYIFKVTFGEGSTDVAKDEEGESVLFPIKISASVDDWAVDGTYSTSSNSSN